jgi:hypothetical protein
VSIRVNISVRDSETSTWLWAVAYARSEKLSTSALIMKALEKYLARVDPEGRLRDADPEQQ